MAWDEMEQHMSNGSDPLDHLLGDQQNYQEHEEIDLLANPEAFRAIDRGEPIPYPMTPDDNFQQQMAAIEEMEKAERSFVIEAIVNAGVEITSLSDLMTKADVMRHYLATGRPPEGWIDPQAPQDGDGPPPPADDPTQAPEAATEAPSEVDAPGASL
jgi:hypothetical protein